MRVPAVVAEEHRRSAVGGHQEVEIAVVVDVGIGRAAPHARRAEVGSDRLRSLDELAFALIVKQVRRLGVLDALLNALDLVFDMAVGDEDVEPAIEVVVEEERRKAQRQQAAPANLRARRLVDEQAISFVVIQRQHLVGEVADDDAGASGVIVVCRIDAHAGARHTVFAEGDAGRDRRLGEAALACC